MTHLRRLALLFIGLTMSLTPAVASQRESQDQTPYDATRLIWRWRAIMNTTLEDSRAFAPEPVVDAMEEFVSPGAVRAVKDKLAEADLKKADAQVERYALAAVAASARQPDGSRIVDDAALVTAERALCPVYPFCE